MPKSEGNPKPEIRRPKPDRGWHGGVAQASQLSTAVPDVDLAVSMQLRSAAVSAAAAVNKGQASFSARWPRSPGSERNCAGGRNCKPGAVALANAAAAETAALRLHGYDLGRTFSAQSSRDLSAPSPAPLPLKFAWRRGLACSLSPRGTSGERGAPSKNGPPLPGPLLPPREEREETPLTSRSARVFQWPWFLAHVRLRLSAFGLRICFGFRDSDFGFPLLSWTR